YLTPDGEEKVRVLREGEYMYCPPGVPHSPRFPPGAFALITERKRRPGERDRFLWFCERCHAKVHEVVFEVGDYAENAVRAAYRVSGRASEPVVHRGRWMVITERDASASGT